ncbi:hypothetical protein VKT23_017116 [Stygiomarasmius scandens]|uniref:Uncharacterized protein n=1 Tax=Marasmiellus scandens TaxID=2682957 RepID=A0ABR1ITH9_9AGAR
MRASLPDSGWVVKEGECFVEGSYPIDAFPSFCDPATLELAPGPRFAGDRATFILTFQTPFTTKCIEINVISNRFSITYSRLFGNPVATIRYLKYFANSSVPYTDVSNQSAPNLSATTGIDICEIVFSVLQRHEYIHYVKTILCTTLHRKLSATSWDPSVLPAPTAMAITTIFRYLFEVFPTLPRFECPSACAAFFEEDGTPSDNLFLEMPGYGRSNHNVFMPCWGRLSRPSFKVSDRLSMDFCENNIRLFCNFEKPLCPAREVYVDIDVD